MKITWASNAPWCGTGYGTQTAQMLKRLLADGHDVAVASNYGLYGHWHVDPVTQAIVFPAGSNSYGTDILIPTHQLHANGEPGWIITLYDVWVYRGMDNEGIPIASWTPVDHDPVTPEVAEWAASHVTIAMSKFGQRALADKGIESMYAPHGIELDVWKPTDALPNGRSVRDSWGVPEDAFVVMVNAANKGNVPPRKSWGEMLQALKTFTARHDDVHIYLHTDMQGVYGGIRLGDLLEHHGIAPGRVHYPSQFAIQAGLFPSEAIAAYYSAADVLLATSMGEGFGLPVIEAQACGTPVIVTDFSAQPELVGAGWAVPSQPYWDFTQRSTMGMPLIAGIEDALEKAYATRGDERLAQAAIAKAAEYDADKVYAENWRPILAQLEEALKPPTRQERRQRARKSA